MARVFITGSSQGLGLLAARKLADAGHLVVLHARNAERADHARRALPAAAGILVADVATIAATRSLADQANALGRFDAVIHNVAIGYREKRRVETMDGLSQLWAVNVLAPYMLAVLMDRPARMIFLSSELHRRVEGSLDDLQWATRSWNGTRAYSESKFQDAVLAMAFAQLWPNMLVNVVEPGWVPTRMGGPRATDDLDQGAETQAWLAVNDDGQAKVSGHYFYHRNPARLHRLARDVATQDQLIDACAKASGVPYR